MLTDNCYVNPNSIRVCFPTKIKKASNMLDDMITVNTFFGHLVKEISITRYEHNKQLISTFSLDQIY